MAHSSEESKHRRENPPWRSPHPATARAASISRFPVFPRYFPGRVVEFRTATFIPSQNKMKPLVISRKDAGVCLFLSLIAFAVSALIAWASWHTAGDEERMARSTEAACEIIDKTIDKAYASQINTYRTRYFLDARNLQTGDSIRVEIQTKDRFNRLNIGETIHLRYDPVESRWFDSQSPRNPPRVGSVFWSCVFLAFIVLSFCGLIHKRPSENKLFRFE